MVSEQGIIIIRALFLEKMNLTRQVDWVGDRKGTKQTALGTLMQ